MRLFMISFVLLLIYLPLQFYTLKVNLSFPHHAYSWTELHGPSWNQILKVPTGGQVVFDRWIRVASGYVLFAFFGVGRDAMDMYRKWLVACGLARLLPFLTERRRPKRSQDTSSHGTFGTLGSRAKLAFRKGSKVSTSQTSTTNMSV